MNLKKMLLLLLLLIIPFRVNAEEYKIDSLSINIDETTWYIFTRDNVYNNPDLDELGVSSDYLNNFMITNNVYLDAIKFYSDMNDYIELFVVKKPVTGNVNNLHTYSDEKINEAGEALMKKAGSSSYDIYSIDNDKYIHMKYYDRLSQLNIEQYYTVVNGYGYTIIIQKYRDITNSESLELKKVVDSSSFTYDSKYEGSMDDNRDSKNGFNRILITSITSAISAGIIGGAAAFVRNRKKKEKAISGINNGEELIICRNCGCKVLKGMDRCPRCNNNLNE